MLFNRLTYLLLARMFMKQIDLLIDLKCIIKKKKTEVSKR